MDEKLHDEWIYFPILIVRQRCKVSLEGVYPLQCGQFRISETLLV